MKRELKQTVKLTCLPVDQLAEMNFLEIGWEDEVVSGICLGPGYTRSLQRICNVADTRILRRFGTSVVHILQKI